MLTRWAGWPAAILVTLLTIALVVGDLVDEGMRGWWSAHALTTDTVSGLLVLLITVLVADQLLSRRQLRDRSRAIAAQAAIVVAQAARASKAVAAVTSTGVPSARVPATTGTDNSGPDDQDARDAATDEVRTYMMMLLVAAPLLIENPVSRHFLEEAQHLGGVMAATLAPLRPTLASGSASASGLAPAAGRLPAALSASGFDDAVARLRAASQPMLKALNPEERAVATATEQPD
jgi:hypothetical protein